MDEGEWHDTNSIPSYVLFFFFLVELGLETSWELLGDVGKGDGDLD